MYPIQDSLFDASIFISGMFTTNYLSDVVHIHEHAIEKLSAVYSPGELLALDAFRVARFVCFLGTLCSLANIIVKCYADFTESETRALGGLQGRNIFQVNHNEK